MRFSILFIFILLGATGFAQTRKYSNEFLAIGVGGRGLAMSRAQVASVNDVTSAYWNPSGLIGLKSNLEIAAQHAEYFAGIAKYDYASVAYKIDDKSAIGFSFLRFGVDDIPNTTQLIDQNGRINYDKITTFSAADYAFLSSYARKIGPEGLSVGGNAKVIYRQVGNMAQAWGFGLDVSLQYAKDKWKFGAVGRDITSTYNAWSFNIDSTTIAVFENTGNEIPQNDLEITLPRFSFGAARTFILKNKVSLLPELNLEVTTDGKRNVMFPGKPFSFDPCFGLEFGYQNILFLRGGVGNIQRMKALIGDYYNYTFQPNIGVGVCIKQMLTIDYALTDIGDQSVALYSNVFSLKLVL